MPRKLIIANWKMNPVTLQAAIRLAKKIEGGVPRTPDAEVVIAPPFPFLLPVANALRKSKLGAQDIFWEKEGAYTGEVSAGMLKDLCVSYCIVGHSERRTLGETDGTINKKIKAALKNQIMPVLAIGEKKRIPNAKMRRVLETQLKKDLRGVSQAALKNGVIAYEPAWAIGTGLSATPEHARKALIMIQEILARIWKTPKESLRDPTGQAKNVSTRILYGGSVNAKNAGAFLSKKGGGMDGMLVGGTSLDAKEFINIIKAAIRAK